MKKLGRAEKGKKEMEKDSGPLLFPPRPKAPIPVRIGAAIALLLLLWLMYLYASRLPSEESSNLRSPEASAALAALPAGLIPAR